MQQMGRHFKMKRMRFVRKIRLVGQREGETRMNKEWDTEEWKEERKDMSNESKARLDGKRE